MSGFTYSVADLYIAHFSDEETQTTQLVSTEPGLEPRYVSSKTGALLSPFAAAY